MASPHDKAEVTLNEPTRSEIPWRRILVEGFAIVTSILIAFGIQAWWDSSRDAATVRGHLNGILQELEVSRDAIGAAITTVRDASAATSAVLALAPGQAVRLDSDSLASILNRSIAAGSITLPVGASEALISSGDLGLINNPSLSSALAGWPALVTRAELNGSLLIQNREQRILPFMAPYMGGLWTGKKSGWLDDYPESRFPLQAEPMFGNPVFEGHFTDRGIRLEVTLALYQRLAAQADSMIASLHTALAR